MIINKNKGFTLVEVLICVGIIGIIAAISIPALLTSTSDKALEAQRKALYSRMAQAFAQMNNLNFYENGTSPDDFLLAFSKVYKLSATCSSDNIKQCGVPDVVYDYYDDTKLPRETNLAAMTTLSSLNTNIPISKFGGTNTKAGAFRTANGESVLFFFNPNCHAKKEGSYDLTYSVCVNMIYDVNGRGQSPNSIGDDIGYMTVFYPSNPIVVAPNLYNKESFSGKFSDMLSNASAKDMVPPTLEELVSILVNQNLTQIASEDGSDGLHWSSSFATGSQEPKVWIASVTDGVKSEAYSKDFSYRYYLLKK